MEVSGQSHAPAALPPGKKPQNRSGHGVEKNSQPPAGNRTPINPSSSPGYVK